MQLIAQVVGNVWFYLVIEPGVAAAPQPQPMAEKLRGQQAVVRPMEIRPKPLLINKRR